MDVKEIKSLIKLLNDADLTEIEVEEKGRKIRICKSRAPLLSAAPAYPSVVAPSEAPSPQDPILEKVDTPSVVISSPIVGTFYRSHAPGEEPYVKVGDRVKNGQVLCIVEAMKLMNEIESDLDGTVLAICVEDKSPVEFGQPLLKIAP